MRAFDLQVFADYHQFYLWDAGTNPEAPEDYTPVDVERMVKVAEHVVVLQPVRNTTVPVRVELHEVDPGFDERDWQHVVECSVRLPTGKLQVHECTGGAQLDVEVARGTYQVRALFTGLQTLSPDGLDGDDRYVVVLWPGELLPLHVVKQQHGARGAP